MLGLSGVPLAVMVVVASLPIGANVFLFSQRYRVAEDLITASVGLSTVLALGTVALVLAGRRCCEPAPAQGASRSRTQPPPSSR